MFSRLVIALFYAAVFFALGAWSGGRLAPVGHLIADGADRGLAWMRSEMPGHKSACPPADEPPAAVAADAPAEAVPEAVLEVAPKAVPDPAAPPADRTDLGAARGAFAAGDIAGAVAAYQAAIAADPQDAEALGELGNVYYSSGQIENAARAYHSAALALAAQGRIGAARALVPTIRRYAPGLAASLQASLDDTAAGPGE